MPLQRPQAAPLAEPRTAGTVRAEALCPAPTNRRHRAPRPARRPHPRIQPRRMKPNLRTLQDEVTRPGGVGWKRVSDVFAGVTEHPLVAACSFARISDPRALEAVASVPRAAFVPPERVAEAELDRPV